MRTKNQKSILVTGIGGNVGQGILRIIRSYYNDIKIIGVNTIEFNPGNCWVDVFYKVPYAVNREEYILKMVEICKIESVDLIIPSTDFETYFLSLSSELFNCRIACNNSEITEICLDKFKTFTEFQKKKCSIFKLLSANSISKSVSQDDCQTKRRKRVSRNFN
jgi:carbamoyl-phosphate synthase large subunit